MALLTGGERFVSYASDNTLLICKLPDGKQIAQVLLDDHMTGVNALAVAPDGKRFLTCHSTGRVVLRDLSNGRELYSFRTPPGNWPQQTRGISISPDGQYAAAGSGNGIVYLWRLPSAEQLRQVHSSR